MTADPRKQRLRRDRSRADISHHRWPVDSLRAKRAAEHGRTVTESLARECVRQRSWSTRVSFETS